MATASEPIVREWMVVERRRDAARLAARVDRALLAFTIVLGSLHAWAGRYAMNPDGISYLDIGDAYMRRDWTAALNAYWSPLYSWLLGGVLWLLRPAARWEFPVVHLVNFLVFVGAVLSFRFFVRSVLCEIRNQAKANDELRHLPEWALWVLGYSLFLWCSLDLITLWNVTPDLLLSAWVFLFGGYLVQLGRDNSWWKFLLCGLLLGLAYLTKGVMFPLGFAFLVILLASGQRSKTRVAGVVLSAVAFLLVASPWVWLLSKSKGRFTSGDAGKLSYAWLVNPGGTITNWQGERRGSGTPVHATRKVLNDPPVFEFSKPVAGTYPPWYDPSYWNEGEQGRFGLAPQARALLDSGLYYGGILLSQSALLVAVVIFLLLGKRDTLDGIVAHWPIVALAIVPMGLYALVLVQARYVGVFFVFLFFAIFAGVRLRQRSHFDEISRCVTAAVGLTILLTIAQAWVEKSFRPMEAVGPYSTQEQVVAAAELQRMGLRAGDQVAVVGDGLHDYWARLAKLRIVAQTPNASADNRDFWAAPPERRRLAYDLLQRAGARVVITWSPPTTGLDAGWQPIRGTLYFAHFLPQ